MRHARGSTFFMNCMQPEPELDHLDYHQSKLIQKLGLLYELSKTFAHNADKPFGSALFSQASHREN